MTQDFMTEKQNLDNILVQLDEQVNEKVKYCPIEELDKSENSLSLVMEVKDILLLMAEEIKSLNLRLLKMENDIKEIKK